MSDKQAANDCPHRSSDCEQICTLAASGLYLPLPHQIAKFCRTALWNSCPQYLRGCEAKLASNSKCEKAQDDGRRRFPRFQFRQNLTLYVADYLPGSSVDTYEQSAWALDFSLVGMRIETTAALPTSAKISFSFSDDFLVPGFTGQAVVCWQAKSHSAGSFQCGLGFIDQKDPL